MKIKACSAASDHETHWHTKKLRRGELHLSKVTFKAFEVRNQTCGCVSRCEGL